MCFPPTNPPPALNPFISRKLGLFIILTRVFPELYSLQKKAVKIILNGFQLNFIVCRFFCAMMKIEKIKIPKYQLEYVLISNFGEFSLQMMILKFVKTNIFF